MQLVKKILFFSLSFLLGTVFLFSAYTKLYPIEPFEFTFVDLGIANWRTAPFVARLFIGMEFFIGALFILNIKIKTTCKISAVALFVFSIYLFGLIFINGNKGNCGCFGEFFPMTPVQALIKNAVMLVLLGLIFKFHSEFSLLNFLTENRKLKTENFLFYMFMISSVALPHILNYVDLNYSEAYLSEKENQFKLELDSLYKNAEINIPPKSLSDGKHIIAFMSLTCAHCKMAARKMKIIKQRNPAISIYFVLNGDAEKIAPFMEETQANNIPYCLLLGKSFVYLAGTSLPAIYLTSNSIVENHVNYLQLDQTEIEKWIARTP